MKKGMFLFGCIMLVVGVVSYWALRPSEIINAQTNSKDAELIARDKAIPEDRLDRANTEAKTMMAEIKHAVQKEFPDFKIWNEYFGSARNNAIGRRGEVHISLGWEKGIVRIGLNIDFVFSEKEAHEMHMQGLNFISMGDFLRSPIPLGDDAVLVANRTYNKSVTNVGIHFVKSRAIVGVDYSNFKRSSAENEKQLIRFVKVVEPLIQPKSTFDDL